MSLGLAVHYDDFFVYQVLLLFGVLWPKMVVGLELLHKATVCVVLVTACFDEPKSAGILRILCIKGVSYSLPCEAELNTKTGIIAASFGFKK